MDLKKYSDFIVQFSLALSDEITYLKNNGGKKYRLFNGYRIYSNSLIFAYTFETDVELYIPDSSPVCLTFNGRDYTGEILHCSEFEITIVLRKDLGINIKKAEFSCEPWKLLEELNKRLDESLDPAKFNLKIAYKLICEGNKMSLFNQDRISKGQNAAIKSSLSMPITIVWGPPGTGKTHTLANIAIEHYIRGNKVLIISHSNIAVDGAILKIHELLEDRKEELLNINKLEVRKGDLLRYGYTRSKELLQKSSLTSHSLTMEKIPSLYNSKTKLESEKEALKSKGIRTSRIFEIENKLQKIRKQIHSHESELVGSAKILATTISKASVDTAVYKNSRFDVVLMDEASMAYIPHACYAAGLARKHFICFGDFRQLSPIALSNTPVVEKWLHRDIYEHLGITDNIDKGLFHSWMVLLDEQRRMHPMISGFANSRIYSMNLRDHPSVELRHKNITEKDPFPNQIIALINLNRTCNVCCKSSDKSRYNLLSAFVSFYTGITALQKGQKSIGIITPYTAQSQLIRSMINDYSDENKNKDRLSCSTVHQFQGSEKDVIVFDCVESYRQTKPGILLTSHINNTSLRLINVAVTRARGKFIAIANFGYWNNKLPLNNSILRHLLNYITEKGKTCSGDKLLKFCGSMSESEKFKWYDGSDCISSFLSDIDNAKKEILMDIPQGYVINEKEIANALTEAKKRGVKVLVRAEKPNELTPQLSRLCRKQPFAWAPITVIDNQTIWYGIPVMNITFISDGDTLPVNYWPVVRFIGKKTAETIIALLEMHRSQYFLSTAHSSNLSGFAGFIENSNIKCKICGSNLVLRKGKSHFLGCSAYPNCKYTHLIDKNLVNAYILQYKLNCIEDGYPLVAAISKHGIFARCTSHVHSHCYDLDNF